MTTLKFYYDGTLHSNKPTGKDEWFLIRKESIKFSVSHVKKDKTLYGSYFYVWTNGIEVKYSKISVSYIHNIFTVENDQYRQIIFRLYELLNTQAFDQEEVCEIMNIISKYLGDLYEQYQCFYESLN